MVKIPRFDEHSKWQGALAGPQLNVPSNGICMKDEVHAYLNAVQAPGSCDAAIFKCDTLESLPRTNPRQ